MSYADQVKDAKKRDVSINLRSSDNGGYIVECSWHVERPASKKSDGCCPSTDYKHKTYVYETLDSALEAIPSLISLKQDLDENDPIDRKIMAEDE